MVGVLDPTKKKKLSLIIKNLEFGILKMSVTAQLFSPKAAFLSVTNDKVWRQKKKKKKREKVIF